MSKDANAARITCHLCGCHHCEVVYVRHGQGGVDHSTRRRRECRYCGKRFSTLELPIERDDIDRPTPK